MGPCKPSGFIVPGGPGPGVSHSAPGIPRIPVRLGTGPVCHQVVPFSCTAAFSGLVPSA
jgi:hypothetical protein